MHCRLATIAPLPPATYNIPMSHANRPDNGQRQPADERDLAFDLTRGIAAYTGSRLVAGLAKVISRHPEAVIGNAFNRKQVACKLWARDRLLECTGGKLSTIWIVGGWYGIFAAMLLEDERFDIGLIDSSDIDPAAAAVARTLLGGMAEKFTASTLDMYRLDYSGGRPGLVVNTSCEHIPDLRRWLDLLPPGTRVLLQSNDYFAEPTHINCMPSLAAFAKAAGLADVGFSGELPMKNYTRFMLIGRV